MTDQVILERTAISVYFKIAKTLPGNLSCPPPVAAKSFFPRRVAWPRFSTKCGPSTITFLFVTSDQVSSVYFGTLLIAMRLS